MLGRIYDSVRTLVGFPVGDRSRSYGWSWYTPGSRIDWREKAGRVYDNAVVSIGIGWLSRSWSGSTLYACQVAADGSQVRYDHPLTNAVEEPNPWYTGPDLWAATVLSLCVSGNAYWVALRRKGSPDPAFVYLRHDKVAPVSDEAGSVVSHYEYTAPGGEIVKLNPDGVVHFRMGLDPADVKRGLSPLAALIREVGTDNMATTYTAALLNRMGVPGMVFTPETSVNLTNEQRDAMRAQVQSAFTQDGAGTMLVMPVPGSVEFPKAGPKDLELGTMANLPTDRILAAVGLSGMALNLGSTHQTFDNYATAIESAWEHGVMPLQAVAARTLQRFARRWYGEPDLCLRYDYANVRALQPDLDRLAKRLGDLFKADVLTRADVRGQLGLEVDDVRDDVFYSEAVSGVRGEGAAVLRAAGRLAQARRIQVESGPEA